MAGLSDGKGAIPEHDLRSPASFIADKFDHLLDEVRLDGHPRAHREDLLAALVDSASPNAAAKALTAYDLTLGAR